MYQRAQPSCWWDCEFVSSLGFLNFNPWVSAAACLLIDPTLLLSITFCGLLSCAAGILLVGCISSKLEMQGIDVDFLQMGAVDCCAESCGFRYEHTTGSQCCRVRSSTEVLLFTGGLLCQIGQLSFALHQAAFLFYWYFTALLVTRPGFGWCDPCRSWWGAQTHPRGWPSASPSPPVFAKVVQWILGSLVNLMGLELCEPFCLHKTQQSLMLF